MSAAAGVELIAKKAVVRHGGWLKWLRENKETLGFDARMARCYTLFAKLATDCQFQKMSYAEKEALWNKAKGAGEEGDTAQDSPFPRWPHFGEAGAASEAAKPFGA